ncbi:hypothetical protein ACU4GD_16480, partial [Cupriavidus basilensis]
KHWPAILILKRAGQTAFTRALPESTVPEVMEDARLTAKNADSADPLNGELVYRIHAARDDEGLRGVIALLRDQFSAGTAVLARRHLAGGQGAVLCGAPDDAAFFRTFAEYSPRNPWFLSSNAYQPLQVIGGDDMLSSSDLVRTDFYHALPRPHQYLHRLCGSSPAGRRGLFP